MNTLIQTQTNQEVKDLKVYFTRNLDQFHFMDGNRVVNPMHVKRLTKSIKESGMLKTPIIVDENKMVIDGQHRILAAKNAESGIYFMVIPGYGLGEVHTLNANQKNWSGKDFMLAYAGMGIESYQNLKTFSEKFPEFTFSSCLTILKGYHTTQSYKNSKNDVFREGTWKHGDLETAYLNANRIREIGSIYPGYKRGSFVLCILSMYRNPKFSHNEFMSKLKLRPTSLVDCPGISAYKILIEEIYNYHRRNKVNLRF